MRIALDHLIVPVNDRAESVAFYVAMLGLAHEGERGPFSMLRVSAGLVLQLAPWSTPGGQHLAFAVSREEFLAAFQRIRAAGIAYGDAFDTVGNMRGPGDTDGARGAGQAVYCFDPNRHLIEILHYER